MLLPYSLLTIKSLQILTQFLFSVLNVAFPNGTACSQDGTDASVDAIESQTQASIASIKHCISIEPGNPDRNSVQYAAGTIRQSLRSFFFAFMSHFSEKTIEVHLGAVLALSPGLVQSRVCISSMVDVYVVCISCRKLLR